jgi:hypothetical protein
LIGVVKETTERGRGRVLVPVDVVVSALDAGVEEEGMLILTHLPEIIA